MPTPRVLVLFNEPILPEGHTEFDSEHEVLDTVQFVSQALNQTGYAVSQLALGHDPAELLEGLRSQQPDAVFNLYEGNQVVIETHVAGLLEWLGMPFTGSPSQALCLARNKHLAQRLFRGAGLPTPESFIVNALPVDDCRLRWPVIVKPACQDASEGLDQGSVVTDQAQLVKRVSYLLDHFGPPVLVEEFIRGRELNVALLESGELKTLPVSEVLFLEDGPGYWPIITYDAKWKTESRECEATPAKYPADVDPLLTGRLQKLARQAFRLLGCRDYARADFRVDAEGQPYLLELNPNPDFNPTAGFAKALASAGWSHIQFTAQLARNALTRRKPLCKPVTHS